MDLAPWIARLKTQVAALKMVGGAAEFGAAQDGLINPPAAYLIPLAEDAADNALVNSVSQRVTVRVGVVLAVRNVRDARGEAGLGELEPLRQAVLTALLGWTPAASNDPVIYSRGQLLALDNATLWWQDEFQTAFYLRAI